MNFIDYLMEVRIREAKRLLADPRKVLADVAQDVGYNGTSGTSRGCSRSTGIQPSKYRKALLLRRAADGLQHWSLVKRALFCLAAYAVLLPAAVCRALVSGLAISLPFFTLNTLYLAWRGARAAARNWTASSSASTTVTTPSRSSPTRCISRGPDSRRGAHRPPARQSGSAGCQPAGAVPRTADQINHFLYNTPSRRSAAMRCR